MTTPRLHSFHHVPFEGLGCIETWAKEKGCALSHTNFFENYSLPGLDDFDWLIIMGGPMGIYEEDKYPWLKEEKAFIKKCIDENKVVIGICLGSQLIAEVIGGEVYQGKEKEIGFFPIEWNTSSELFSSMPNPLTVFHWHGDTFHLPEEAILHASSQACQNQIFQYNKTIFGFQCHLEVTKESMQDMLDHGQEEIVDAPFIQTEEEIHSFNHIINELNQYFFNFLDALEYKTHIKA